MFPSNQERQPRALEGFEILERLGAGGVGQVFLARSRGGKLVAIKVLSDAAERDDEFSATLAREASLCVRLNHPAIVQVRAFVEESNTQLSQASSGSAFCTVRNVGINSDSPGTMIAARKKTMIARAQGSPGRDSA